MNNYPRNNNPFQYSGNTNYSSNNVHQTIFPLAQDSNTINYPTYPDHQYNPNKYMASSTLSSSSNQTYNSFSQNMPSNVSPYASTNRYTNDSVRSTSSTSSQPQGYPMNNVQQNYANISPCDRTNQQNYVQFYNNSNNINLYNNVNRPQPIQNNQQPLNNSNSYYNSSQKPSYSSNYPYIPSSNVNNNFTLNSSTTYSSPQIPSKNTSSTTYTMSNTFTNVNMNKNTNTYQNPSETLDSVDFLKQTLASLSNQETSQSINNNNNNNNMNNNNNGFNNNNNGFNNNNLSSSVTSNTLSSPVSNNLSSSDMYTKDAYIRRESDRSVVLSEPLPSPSTAKKVNIPSDYLEKFNLQIKELTDEKILQISNLSDDQEGGLIYRCSCRCEINNNIFYVPIYIKRQSNIQLPPIIIIREKDGHIINENCSYINKDKTVILQSVQQYNPNMPIKVIFEELQQLFTDQFPLRDANSRIPPLIDLSDIIIESDHLGSGATGAVQGGTYHGLEVAIKYNFNPIYNRHVESYYREIQVQYNISHPNVIKIFGIVRNGDIPGFVMERGKCSLKSFIDDKSITISPDQYKSLFIDILSSLVCIHKMDYIHGDIKTENYILMKDGHCKLTDFGSCVKYNKEGNVIKGTFHMQSPELLRGDNKVTNKTDIYSVGCVLYECLTRDDVYKNCKLSEYDLSDRIIHNGYRPQFPSDFPLVYRGLISRCWDDNPQRRPSAQKLLEEIQSLNDII